ncbi:uncharacterized protein BCR38DRAFT_447411 [Pseudomassariella vexata]|uniref:Uncharacterized protein n=1 Tax=Pseudomassariella vexata TaxID=1141098 RepID=A0A1Y2DGU9_9PEZI|nr:uncharacterized protein BCR38DRAFT_447411 [Pseudomassariella vexata]ORY58478.1 hypothetical protein BCR38DRAFT_447411 [Pseudomassariella vexata]
MTPAQHAYSSQIRHEGQAELTSFRIDLSIHNPQSTTLGPDRAGTLNSHLIVMRHLPRQSNIYPKTS